ncbi:type IV toxin-antitoxin system AbiEi family antitoxin domain-containing protein [Peribacillus muralis]|uniref:type IV toxin-antitoxin system AbiEi family antitoxin domain-containing protein n=1 Tax=Peribacillus muralis TaxID=264697 RepID=UPI003CFE903E
MARPNRYQIMDLFKEDIISELKQKNDLLLSLSDIESVLAANRRDWRLPESTTLFEFLEYLVTKKHILKPLEFGTESRKVKKYIYTKNSNIDINLLALSLYSNSYLSHYSAVMFHDLTDEIIKSKYVNHEQSKKEKKGTITIAQQNIDNAFSKPMRSTNNFLDYNEQRIYIINGKFSDNLGVINRNNIKVTDIERTLIDITVRPQYAGGVYEVLKTFKKAQGEASVNRIATYLKKLEYIYPYHQAIGFYLERAGYKENAINSFESKFSLNQNFYLTYDMKDTAYDKRWQLYYPKNI